MISPSNVERLHAHQTSSDLTEIRFTRRMRDVLVRNGLESKYLARFVRDAGTFVVYALTLDEMGSLLEQLEPMRTRAERYDKVTIDALERSLERKFFAERTKGLSPAPDVAISSVFITEASKLINSPACLRVGDPVRLFGDKTVTVAEPYGLYQHLSRSGRFYTPKGERVDFTWGYVVRYSDGSTAVSKTCYLSHLDGSRAYLKLLSGGGNDE